MIDVPPTIFVLADGLGWFDYGVLAAYLIATVLIGVLTGSGQKTLDEYCLAGQRVPWWAACISIVATDLSGISYMGVPAWMYTKDMKYFFGSLLMPLVMLAVVMIFLPIFFRVGVYTVYQYLEARFHPMARTITAVLFLLRGFVWLGGAVYIPSLALSAFTDIPVPWCILIVGVCTTFYTVLGGMHAVIWTDLMQFIVLVGGLVVMILIGMSDLNWDVSGVWNTASSMTAPGTNTPHTTMVDWSFNFSTEATVWSLFFFYFIYNMGTYGTDQVLVQRYLTVGSYKEVVKSVMGSSLVGIFSVALLVIVGIIFLVYYRTHADLAATLPRPDMIMPHYVVNVLPTGMKGLIFAAIFAATMSTVSAALNSFSTVGVVDLYKRLYRPGASDAHYLRVAQVMTLVGGMLITALGLLISLSQTTIVQTIAEYGSKFIGPITGMFFLGVMTKRANLPGVIAGAAVGLAASWADTVFPAIATHVNWMWTAPLGCLVTFVVGYLVSLMFPNYRAPEPPPPAVEQRGFEPIAASPK